ncbi:unnamed protein product [Prunus armeniaca]|uniref:Uncharacterized protein n=1 Tax=Prunus armeniaca TaxID=36596 RepID=A0A6J5UNV9_PRUAR|nr:unnamed protein product [Prunus armeniaca]
MRANLWTVECGTSLRLLGGIECFPGRGSIPGHSIFSEGTSYLARHHGIALSLTGCLLRIGMYN